MLFPIFILFIRATNVLDDSQPDSTPLAVPISVSAILLKTNLNANYCNEDIKCDGDNFYNPECGSKCWSNKKSGDYFELTFEGVKFEVFGSYASNNGHFNIYLDNKFLETINLYKEGDSIHRTRVFESNVIEYGQHTVRLEGFQDEQFEIFKITYWPWLKAKRLNISDFQSLGNWNSESDKAGGERAWTNANGAKKYTTIEGSRIWVYGSKAFNHGDMTIKFNGNTAVESEQSDERIDSTLIYKSDEVPFGSYQVEIENAGDSNTILFYCLYYLYDPPAQTLAPHPSRTLAPNTGTDYINKQFIGTITPNEVINIPDSNSPIKQISGCTFTNINVEEWMIIPTVEVIFYDNVFEYTDPSLTTKPVMWTKAPKFTFTSCTFRNFKDQIKAAEGTIYSVNLNNDLRLETCQFINCGSSETQFMFKMNSVVSSFKAYGCTFSFDDTTKSCRICSFKFDDVLFDGCTFTKSGNGMISFINPNHRGTFTFTNNIVEGNTKTFINAPNIRCKPVISGNIFRDIELTSEYLISYIHTVTEIELINNTFSHISCSTNGKYGGGTGLWFQRDQNLASVEFSLIFDQCKFHDNMNARSASPYNQGGAIQFGYTTTIANTIMTFQECEFKRNRCLNGMGGAISMNINRNLIIRGCIFEDNEANDKGGAIYIWGKIVQPPTSENAGAPAFSGILEMDTIKISECEFIGNKCENGHCIYIEEENIENVSVEISSSTFVNNGLDSSDSNSYNIRLTKCISLIDDITISFEDSSRGFGGIDFGKKGFTFRNSKLIRTRGKAGILFSQLTTLNDPIIIENCIFDNCESTNNNNRCMSITAYTTSITFDNNTIQNMQEQGNSGYSVVFTLKTKVSTFIINEMKFLDNRCNSDYGGGSGLWITGTDKIEFNNCEFINNIALKSPNKRNQYPTGYNEYFTGDGGGIQYGFSQSISNVDLTFEGCLFRQNKAVRHGGAIAIQTQKTVEIIRCTFEGNVANYQTTTSIEMLYDNHYNKKPEGRGGAIYLNPSFTSNQGTYYLKSVKIEGCTFRGNKAYDGHAIYIEGDQCETQFIINNNDFIDNYDTTSYSNDKTVIGSEISPIYDDQVISSNRFSYTNSSIYVSPFRYVDHYGRPATSTPTASQSPTPLPTPTAEPLAVPISVSVEVMKKEGLVCNEDISCSGDNFYNPECGQKCWSSRSSSDYIEYTFEGVKFEVYGSIAENNGKFDLKLDGELLTTIDLHKTGESIHRTNVFISDILSYGSHTVRIQGRQGEQFEIFKITYWPSLQAKRLNISDFQSLGNWNSESDKAGGERAWTNANGAKKYTTIEGSRIWVYGSKAFNHGDMTIKFNGNTAVESEQSDERIDSTLIYKSDEVPFGSYQVEIENAGDSNTILFYCLYYLYDPPAQTLAPHPSRTLAPNTGTDYINKQFIGTITPNEVINIPDSNSPIKQISGCTFTNINVETWMITPTVEVIFYDNVFEYTDPSLTTKPVMWTKAPKFTFTSCTFRNFKDQIKAAEGTIYSVNLNNDLRLETCQFINCGSSETQFMFKMNSVASSFKAYGCTFSFDDTTKSCRICSFKFDDVLFDGCTFTKSGNGMISFINPNHRGTFTFTNNIVEGNTKTFINAPNIRCKPVISGNIFRDIELTSEYLISYIHTVTEIELINNTFSHISCSTNGKYGGGTGLWFQRDQNLASVEFSLIFDQCKFHDNMNARSASPYNQGGAIQFGYTTTIANTIMTFQECEFKRNRCLNGMGGAISMNINRNLIIRGCIFEDNEANDKGGAIYIWGKIVQPPISENAGAPAFSGILEMDTIKISECEFIGNKCENGHCIYIEEENIENVSVEISSSTFVNNGLDSSDSNSYNIRLTKCISLIDDITISFEDSSRGFGGIDFGKKGFTFRNSKLIRTRGKAGILFSQLTTLNDPITIENCIFDNCESTNNNNRCMSITAYTTSITFDNNTIQNMQEQGNSGYSVVFTLKTKVSTFIINEMKFLDNRCNSDYGGGSGLWITGTDKIEFNNCEFINNIALKSPNKRNQYPTGYNEYFTGDGGGIQYGFSQSISNVDLTFEGCLFRQNKAVRHGGAIAIQTQKTVEIIRCTFEGNVANYQTTTSIEMLYDNHYNKKPEGRGGAIYLNPSFTSNQGTYYLKSVKIEGCTFRGNKAYDGHAIYIEGDQCETQFIINNNDFIDNYDTTSYSNDKTVIGSEISPIYDDQVISSNRFSYTNSSIYVSPFRYVDHYGRPATSTPTASQSPTPLPTPTAEPLAVPISVSVEVMKKEGLVCNEDISCSGDNFYNPECGKKCWSSRSSSDYIEYTFEGVKFEVYGSIAENNGKFDLKLDGELLTTIDLHKTGESIHRTNVFISDILSYGSHTVRIQGRQGEQFEIFKITYWPSLQAKRLNISDFQSLGNWNSESDKAGGERAWTNANGAKKYTTIEGSRIWVYGSKAFNHGDMTIKFNGNTAVESEQSDERIDSTLIYKSDEVPFGSYQVEIENAGDSNTILFYCLYYLYDPPAQTLAPHPSRTLAPNTGTDYINKQFIGTITPNGVINIPDSNSPIKQISGCTFTNINVEEWMIIPTVEVIFYDNVFEYTDPSLTTKPVMWTKAPKFTFTSCTFRNFKDQIKAAEGTIYSVNLNNDLRLETCQFINCGSSETQFMFKMNSVASSFKAYGCTFSFDDTTKSCRICSFKFDDVLFDGCTFTKSGNGMISFINPNHRGTFTFTNNIVEGNTKTFINAPNIRCKPVISGNIFRDIELTSEYLISYIHTVTEIELINNTFSHISCSTNGKYGGGTGLWFQRDQNLASVEFSLIFDQCKFHDNMNARSASPYNQGGAIQFGYTTTIANTIMTFQECEFKRNRCLNGMGGAISMNINRNLIIRGCIFEDNEANDKGGAIYIWGKIVQPPTSENAGAPAFSGILEMDTIKISECEFIGNKCENGHCIYIEEENIENVSVEISSSTFVNNGLDSSDSNSYNIRLTKCISLIDDITISFEDSSRGFGGIDFGKKGFTFRNSKLIRTRGKAGILFSQLTTLNDPITIENCIFDNCESTNNNNRCMSITAYTTSITFDNNTIQNMQEQGNSGYSVVFTLKTKVSTFIINEMKFLDNRCNSDYGGGSGLWITGTDKIEFNNCEFINNIALKSPNKRNQYPTGYNEYFTGDGGGIQYGFSQSISNVDLTFEGCLFRQNKAVRHGGAIAIQTQKTVEIIRCTFEGNVANYQTTTSIEMLYDNHYNKKPEGRGGAIYLNPSFTSNQGTYYLKSVKIEGCTFRRNTAYDGHAIYIEGDQCETHISINNNDFINNYNKESGAVSQAAISSEIQDVFTDNIVELNRFSYSLSDVKVAPFMYVDHNGIAVPSTPAPTVPPSNGGVSDNTANGYMNSMSFDCPVDSGYVKIFIQCTTCTVKNDIWFKVTFENGDISNVEYDTKVIQSQATIEDYAPRRSMSFDKKTNVFQYQLTNANMQFDAGRTVSNINCIAPATQTPPPSKSPRATMTPASTPTPEPTPQIIHLNENNCSTNGARCEEIIEDEVSVHVFIEVSKFNNFDQTNEDGGAIHLIDCCLTCNDTPFNNCQAKRGGGGAIYIKNNLNLKNNVTLTLLTFENCKAYYGGAVYIYCGSKKVPVSVNTCTFTGNELIPNNNAEDDNLKTGGKSIFVVAKKGRINNCNFKKKQGSTTTSSTEDLKYVGKFDEDDYLVSKSSARGLSNDYIGDGLFSITKCKFEIDEKSRSAISYLTGKSATKLEIKDCIFTGDLHDGAHYITEKIIGNESPKMIVKSCKFAADSKNSLNVDLSNNLISGNVFNYDNSEERNYDSNTWKIIAAIVIPALSVIAIAAVVAVIYVKMNRNQLNDDSDSKDSGSDQPDL